MVADEDGTTEETTTVEDTATIGIATIAEVGTEGETGAEWTTAEAIAITTTDTTTTVDAATTFDAIDRPIGEGLRDEAVTAVGAVLEADLLHAVGTRIAAETIEEDTLGVLPEAATTTGVATMATDATMTRHAVALRTITAGMIAEETIAGIAVRCVVLSENKVSEALFFPLACSALAIS